jgi:murein DD-endopeptidase MepM/ murein hydrolase activator NlpD
MVNFFGRKYYLNTETLRFEQVRLSSKQKIRLSVFVSLGVILLAIGLRTGFEKVYSTPKEIIYTKENVKLRRDYMALNENLLLVESQLSDLKNRDDRLYRSILEMEPVPSSIREGGTGGSQRYTAIRNITDPEIVLDVFSKMDKISKKIRFKSNSLEDLYEKAVENKKLLACKPSIHPISPADPFWLTSTFGYRSDPFTKRRTAHFGIDLAGPYGIEIHATGDGVITTSHYNRDGYGKEIVVDHGFGYSTRFAHLQEFLVKPGDKVYRGQVIGLMGSTGRSTGPHLHYEVRYMNKAVNPMYYFYENLSPSEFRQLASRANTKSGNVPLAAFSKK